MQFVINVGKGHLYFLSVLFVLIGSVLFVLGQGTTEFGHSAEQVIIGSLDKSLEDAVADKDLMAFDLECISGRFIEGNGEEKIYQSSMGNTYPFEDIFSTSIGTAGGGSAPVLTCLSPWTLAGCSASSDQTGNSNNNEKLTGANRCSGDAFDSDSRIHARCCRIVAV
ncbi:MAG: hypothetical protein Q8Q42_04410 [Nanoarchaeota archaeon]|nr:hypothetical protein [Nanoarchaeota archaeon]